MKKPKPERLVGFHKDDRELVERLLKMPHGRLTKVLIGTTAMMICLLSETEADREEGVTAFSASLRKSAENAWKTRPWA